MRLRDSDKEQLVKEKAIRMIVQEGLEGFSMNKLAKACGISVATLYIYYKDKDDLIITIGKEEADKLGDAVLKDFDPEANFEAGLRQQWKNRASYMMENATLSAFFDQLRSSSYADEINAGMIGRFRDLMGKFIKNAIDRGEVNALPIEVYWSVAFAPLYNLIRFHHEGKSIGGKKFVLTHEVLWQTFALVIKALRN